MVLNKYNCSVDLKLSAFENAVNILGNTPVALYLSDVTNLAFHDLTPENHHVPPGANLLLGLGQTGRGDIRRQRHEFVAEVDPAGDAADQRHDEVLDERGVGGDLLGVNAKLLDNDIFDFFFDGFFRHGI